MKAGVVIAMAVILGAISTKITANEAPMARVAPTIDGLPDEAVWKSATWVNMDQSILETVADAEDFRGRYKVVWTADFLYVLAEITDSVLIDSTSNPLVSYWNDDTLEVFIDEDASGGNHLNNDNAYAYHIALDNQIVDKGLNGDPRTYPTHVKAKWKRNTEAPNQIYWEARIAIFAEGATAPRQLSAGETLGFMVAYCDSDSVDGRKHFFGDVEIEPVNGDRNLGYIDASVFGELTLTIQKN